MRSATRSLSGLTAQGDGELPRITAPAVSNDAVLKLQGGAIIALSPEAPIPYLLPMPHPAANPAEDAFSLS